MLENKEEALESEVARLKKVNQSLIKRLESFNNESSDAYSLFQFTTALEKTVEDKTQLYKQAKEEAEKANKAKSEFLATISHEIRTPMNGVMGMLDLLLNTPVNHRQRHLAQTAYSSAESLLAVINDILDFSKIESGKLSIANEPFNLHALLEDVMSFVADSAYKKDLELIPRLPQNIDHYFLGDEVRLRQILINLLGNAIKFTDLGEVALHADVRKISNKRFQLRVSIRDTGIGIDAASQKLIFRPFEQARGEMTTRKYGGTGLGLAITNDLVQLMGGNLTLESQPDEGSVFEFNIPLIAGAAIEDAGEVVRLDGVRLLIIDGHPVNCDILKNQVSQWGVIADCTNSTASALLKLRQATKQNQPFQHVLLDWHMPEMNGLELAQIINQDNNIAKVEMALFSSASFDLNSNELNKNGIACFLHKPIKRHDLHDCLLKLSKLHAKSVDGNVISTDSARMRKEFHILLAEDNIINQEVAEGYLGLYGCSVDIAENGQQATAAAQKKSYDLILMDCNMPVLDGYEASTLLRKNESIRNHSAVPIVALTADISQGIKDRCLQAGMNDYLSKPFTQQQLQTMLEKWLNTPSLSNPEDNHPKDMMQIDEQRIEQLKKLSERSSRDVLGNAISHYKKIAPNYLGLMQKALEDKDLQLISDYAHSLKSTSGALGLMDIANRCQSVEDNAKNSLITSLREDINSINRLIPEALAFLDEV